MRTSRFALVALALSLALTWSACAPDDTEPAGPGGGDGLEVTLHADGCVIDRSLPMAFRFTVANLGGESRQLLVYRTPLDGLDADIFEVAREGVRRTAWRRRPATPTTTSTSPRASRDLLRSSPSRSHQPSLGQLRPRAHKLLETSPAVQ
jgi:hypothetical protein